MSKKILVVGGKETLAKTAIKCGIGVVVGQGEQFNCVLCKSIEDCIEIINLPLDCGSCGKTHTI